MARAVTIQDIISGIRTTYSHPLEAGEDLMFHILGDLVTVKALGRIVGNSWQGQAWCLSEKMNALLDDYR